MFGLFDDIFVMDEEDINAVFMSMIEEDEMQDFDEYWDEHYNNNDFQY